MKRIWAFFKGIFLGPFILLVFNKMAAVMDVFIPLNFFTIFIVGILGIPGLVILIIVYFVDF